MNPFTQHPREQGVTYQAHMKCVMGIALRLFHSAIAFTMHAILPCIGIKHALDLGASAGFLRARNDWIEAMKRNKSSDPVENSIGGGLVTDEW